MEANIKFDDNGRPYFMWGDSKIQLEDWPATEKFYREKAEVELRETPENVAKGLRELRELLKDEPSLNVPVDDDEFLLVFLRPCKFYAESAFKKMCAFYKFRQAHPQYCEELVPSSVHSPFDHSLISIMAPRDQHGRRIMFVESGFGWNPREVPLTELFRGVQLSLEAAMKEPRTQISGVNVILDMTGLGLSHVMQFTPSFAKMLVEFAQDCSPIRLKAIHILNQPYVFNMVFALFKPFLREKLRSRIHFHGSNMESLKAHVDGSALRKRHGGTLPECEMPGDIVWKMLLHYEDDFRRKNSYGYKIISK